MPPWAVPFTALASFALMGALGRTGCPCRRERAGGIGAAAGLAVHRFVEEAALALTTSIAVMAALLVHAAGEGLALAALLGAQPGRRTACWLCEGGFPGMGMAAKQVAVPPRSSTSGRGTR
ncbi:hypothetical protein ABZ920_00895 [Streptomyces sp. NPDC046831]|uniref:hypothetical protein n=1 Tax=Streptomyces sp. NPDC046831 TaxID=3154805 RepID=UPI0033C240D3